MKKSYDEKLREKFTFLKPGVIKLKDLKFETLKSVATGKVFEIHQITFFFRNVKIKLTDGETFKPTKEDVRVALAGLLNERKFFVEKFVFLMVNTIRIPKEREF